MSATKIFYEVFLVDFFRRGFKLFFFCLPILILTKNLEQKCDKNS